MIRFAVQVNVNEDWLWVTKQDPNGNSSQRILVTFDSQQEAEVEAKKYNSAKIIRLEDET